MQSARAILALLICAAPSPASAQNAAPGSEAQRSRGAAPVIACASLANLRAVLRKAGNDPAAAVPIVTDPRSDLGCQVLDRGLVTAIADHVALNGRTYDCLALQNTSICHWTVAGSVVPPAPKPAPEATESRGVSRRR